MKSGALPESEAGRLNLSKRGYFEPVLRPEPLPKTPLLDMHCHVAGIGAGNSGCFVSERLLKSWKLRFYLRSFGTSLEELREQGDLAGGARLSRALEEAAYVRRAVILAMDGPLDHAGELDRAATEFYVPNDFVASLCAQHRNLLFGASVNPHRKDALERLDDVVTRGACLLKWLPSIQNIDPGEEKLVSFYKRLVELGLPLLTHTGSESSFTRANDELADPGRLRLPLEVGVVVVAAHAAWPGRYRGERAVDRLARMMREFPRLYADISSLTQLNKHGALREILRRPEFHGRLVYGTDFPLVNMPIVSPWYFPRELGPRKVIEIRRIRNPWDRDALLKQSLGVPADVFTRAEEILRLPDTEVTPRENKTAPL
jgi:predicted TIM-barrel fold metal-dependent hydrolase